MSRSLLQLTGTDAVPFLQNLVTNDVTMLQDGAVYAALLTPQGKFLVDFFVFSDGSGGLLMDVAQDHAAKLLQRLTLYRLRADVKIEHADRHLHRGTGTPPVDGWADPRHPDMGWRAWRDTPQPNTELPDWDARRVAHLIPEIDIELTPDSYILECNFEAINGVDFRKGCYVGQEVTARMKHKTTLRKGLVRVHVSGAAQTGDDIVVNGKVVGQLLSRVDDTAIAYVRYDRAAPRMECGAGLVSVST
ncbi:MAG: folate-binding protein [Pseudomonadota bacterium]